jgi:hypothetical protein
MQSLKVHDTLHTYHISKTKIGFKYSIVECKEPSWYIDNILML